MRVAVTGASGLVGSALVRALRGRGDDVLRYVRRAAKAEDELAWDPASGPADAEALAGLDAVVHLAGAGIADRPWTSGRRRVIRESRVVGTARLAEAVAAAAGRGPRVLVCASAVGFYGDRGDEKLTEESAPGEGFLAEVVRDWEAAAEPARRAGVRVAQLRSGVVLSRAGGALARMLPAFRLAAGARLGSGRQYFAWITLDDTVAAYVRALDHEVSGPVNVVAPGAVTNAEFTRALGRALHRPAPFAAPAWLLRLGLGDLADEALLASQRVVPARLAADGFGFGDPEIGPALERLVG
jgi:uncharacterized protein (TIGR01777 family)